MIQVLRVRLQEALSTGRCKEVQNPQLEKLSGLTLSLSLFAGLA